MELLKLKIKSHELANQVTIFNIESEIPSFDEKDSAVMFRGNLYTYKVGDSTTLDEKALNSWFNYVLFAGILAFRFKKSRFKVNIGLNLRNYYQDINHYLSFKRQKKLNYVSRGKATPKNIDIVDFQFYPNIFAQAVAFSKIMNKAEFVLLKFGKEDFEGIYFNSEKKKEKQYYILGDGLNDYLNDLDYSGPEKGKNPYENKLNQRFDSKIRRQLNQYFRNQILKKINRLIAIEPNSLIVLVRDNGISAYLGEILASNIKGGNVIFNQGDSNSIASEGLFIIDEFEIFDGSLEKVGVAVSNDKTNFTSRKNSFQIK